MPRTRALVRALVLASHPGPTAAVSMFAFAYALGAGAGVPLAALVLVAVMAGQLSVGWSNDWIDAGRDLAVGRADKPVVTGAVSPPALRAAALLAAGACIALSLALGPAAAVVHLVAVASAWAYNARLKSTVWSWAPYALSFGLLPSVATLALPDPVPAPAWTTAAAALLGVGAHLANVLPDLADDAATGVVGLPHRLGRRATSLLSVALLLVATTIVAVASSVPVVLAVVAVLAAVVLALSGALAALTRPASRWPFLAAILVAALTVVLLVVG
ncbi:UbiA family prenyltransferase [Cellulomonas rhizosphaerae]|uniref:Ubiquinone biosynthesis protein UbiA n=1 Tax=Cellulomonas rhizosphaerae TaxID=2293719 RepID=A0A413RMM0_9CELL|nr:UbiA family prenyltransferase [Cellulomonas rhizosphaerae]RHA42619.1 ubiquinone biosynthesis protein UbiA [Cellulomonas rhizosphaerae]